MRTITLRAYNGDVHTIPYSSIDVVTNMTKDFSVLRLRLIVAYKEDVDRVIDVLREIDSQLRREWPYRRLMLEPLRDRRRRRLPRVRRAGQGAHQGRGPASSGRSGGSSTGGIKRRFDELGIEIPVPQQTVHVVEQLKEPVRRSFTRPEVVRAEAAAARPEPPPGRPPPAGLVALAASACGRRPFEGLIPGRTIQQGPPLPYRVELAGDLPAAVRDLLRQISRTEQQVREPPSTELAIRRRAQEDVPRLESALRSLGYYEGVVETDLVPPAPAAGGGKPGPYLVRFQVDAGTALQLRRAAARAERQPERLRGPLARAARPRGGRAGPGPGRARCRAEAAGAGAQGRLRAGGPGPARDRDRRRAAHDGRDAAAGTRPQGHLRRGHLHRQRRHEDPLPARSPGLPGRRPVRPGPAGGGPPRPLRHRPVQHRHGRGGQGAHRRRPAPDLRRPSPRGRHARSVPASATRPTRAPAATCSGSTATCSAPASACGSRPSSA